MTSTKSGEDADSGKMKRYEHVRLSAFTDRIDTINKMNSIDEMK